MKVIEQICQGLAVIDDSRIAEEEAVRTVFSFPRSAIAWELVMPLRESAVVDGGGLRLRASSTEQTRFGRCSIESPL